MTDHDRAQLAALGACCARCGTPAHPRGGHGYTAAGYACPPADVVAALREELARVTAERDAAVADLDIERDSRDINRGLDAAVAVRAMYRESDANDALAAVTAERDALRAALGDLFTARSAYEAELSGREAPETVQAKIARAAGAMDEAWERALDVLARTGGAR